MSVTILSGGPEAVAREERLASDITTGIRVLAGDELGPSDQAWQDVAFTLSTNLKTLANMLDKSRRNGHFGDSGFTAVAMLSWNMDKTPEDDFGEMLGMSEKGE